MDILTLFGGPMEYNWHILRSWNQPLVENIAKKNRIRFSIAVLLTTLICSR